MIFNHCPPVDLQELTTETINGKRHYITPSGSYPSITSVLSAFPKPELYEWRKRVGEEKANEITKTASSRGTKVHSLCEKYLLNEHIDYKSADAISYTTFSTIKPILNRISDIHYLECPLYSNRLKAAGRVDCIAEFDNTLSIIDFKTSRKEKKEEWILDYFIQTSFYSLAYHELTGILAKQIVIIIAVDDGQPQVFIKKTKDYLELTIKKIKDYYRLYHT